VVAVTLPVEYGDVLFEVAMSTVAHGGRAPSPERLEELATNIEAVARQTRAGATLRAYSSDWADFVTWCATIGLVPLPARPATVAGYVSEMVRPPDDRRPLRVSTITRRLAAIGQIHKVAGQPNPC
jgi:hypothetical protein